MTVPKWLPLTQYLGELHKLTDRYKRYKNVFDPDVQKQPGRIIIYWHFPKTDRRAQEMREFMEGIYNINVSYLSILEATLNVRLYEQTLSFVSFILRMDLLVPHYFPELIELQQSPVPWDLPKLIAALDKVAIDRKSPW
jgi:hypothetical protein